MLDKKIQEQIDAIFAEYDHPTTPGCALGVVREGELVYSRGYGMADLESGGPITTDTVFHLASVSKQFTAACVALLEEAGEISLEDDIHRYVDFLPDYGHELKLRHLVYMTNGLEDFYDVTSLIMGIPEGNYFSRQEAIRIIRAADWLKFPPGEQWSYGNTGYFLLACVIEKVSGCPFDRFAREEIFGPLGMAHTFFRTNRFAEIPDRAKGYARFPKDVKDPSGPGFNYRLQNEMVEICGPGQAWSTVNDLALWERNFYDNRLGGKGSHLIEKMSIPGRLDNGEATHYAYGQFLGERNGQPVIFHEGGAAGVNTVIYRLPRKKLSIICLANTSDFLTVLLRKLGEECYEKVAGIISPREPVSPPPSPLTREPNPPETGPAAEEEIPVEGMRALAGKYEDPASSHIWEISLEAGRLSVLENYANRFPLRIDQASGPAELKFTSIERHLRGSFCRPADRETGPFSEIHVHQEEASAAFPVRNFRRFLEMPLPVEVLLEYEGLYTCAALETRYKATAARGGVRLENLNTQNDFLNVLFTPTIRDMFLARYPPLIGWYVVHFRRDPAGWVKAFTFRDEVPGRERWLFERAG
jgi:CubicO group peptidase (beta-lactamase class C family)